MLNTAVIAEEGSSKLSGTIEFNGVTLLKGEMTWSIPAMQKLLRRKCRGKPIVSVRLNRLSCNEEVMNQLMEFTVEAVSEEGLQQLRFSEFHAKIEFDYEILDRLAQKCSHLTILTIRDMNRASEQMREALVHLATQITRTNRQVTNLWISRLGSSEEGDQLLDALCASEITTVKYLNFGDNRSWWTNPSAIDILTQFIAKQTLLEELHLQKNNLNAASTAKILSTIRNSGCMSSIKKIQLEDSNWETQESCEELAHVISEAPKLEVVQLLGQKGARKIEVEVQSAKPSPVQGEKRIRDRGNVRIFDKKTNENICQLNTWRVEEINIGQ